MKTNYYSGSGSGCSLASVFLFIILLILVMLLVFSCSPAEKLTESQRVEKLDEFCRLWQDYKVECYNDSVEWCEYEIGLDEFDSVCWFEHSKPTIDGFYYYLQDKEFGDEN